MALPLFNLVNAFNRDLNKFKQWVKYIERYAQLIEMGDTEILEIVHVTCI